MSRKLLLTLLVLVTLAGAVYVFMIRNDETVTVTETSDNALSSLAKPEQRSNQQGGQQGEKMPDILVINKQNPIQPLDYVPDLVVPDVRLRLSPGAEQMQIDRSISDDIKAMFAAAEAEGVTLVFGSGYRSAGTQKQFYDSYVARDGKEAADTYSARPGYSEHQSGLSFDVTSPSGACHLEICFENTPEGQWMAANAADYGFILRYPDGASAITGYQYEPWHFRYVGAEYAQEITARGLTLEEYLGLSPAPTY